ncbi:MAG: beta-L-arabinofuranosidase domain-containing protein [Bryobacteraceae bacterium]
MSELLESGRLSRRRFAALAAAGSASGALWAQVVPQNAGAESAAAAPPRRGTQPPAAPFQETLSFTRKEAPAKVQHFPPAQVRLMAGPFQEAQEENHGVLRRLPADRLIHNFRVNAGLPSPAEPLGGWEKPDCELRGHFTGHFLSACGLMYSATGDQEIKAKGDYIVAELAKCQQKLAGGYLSAFPTELFDRLSARKEVWAPFYTIHKIMAGMLDMYQHCGNRQALEVLQGMADWTGKWSAPFPEPHMQDILNTEYGGMNEILYNLAAVTGDDRYGRVGDRFTKKRFFNPLALRRDELRGLHVNTHVPQVIGAARRYELTSDWRFRDVADYFWYEVTSARAYVTGGTSNNEGWLVDPGQLAAELQRGANTAECCCAYNMLKLTRQLYAWTADPRYFDYYERTLLNHRLGAIEPKTGATIYYLSVFPGAWKTFNSEYDSFWCCTGTGVEEFSKLNDSIYFHDDDGIYVNLFVPSEVNWPEKGVRIRQETKFPEGQMTALVVSADKPVRMTMHIRVPSWLTSGGSVRINGNTVGAFSGPGSYLSLSRIWKSGDRVEMALPMRLHIEAMPDDPAVRAILYGPLVLAGRLGSEGLTKEMVVGRMGPEVRKLPMKVPAFHAPGADPSAWIKPADGEALAFRTVGQERNVTLVPFNRLFGERYSIYWQVS